MQVKDLSVIKLYQNSYGHRWSSDLCILIWLQYLAYFLGAYFAIGVVFDLFTLGVLGISTFQYSTNSGAFLKAVQDVAGSGRDSQLSVAQKASVAVNTAKVAGALNTIAGMLKVSFWTLPYLKALFV